MTNKTVDVRLADGATVKTVPTVWSGEHLAVHRPLNSEEPDGLSKIPRYWSVSHKATGYLAGPSLDAAQRDVIALAKLWDQAFASVTAAGDAKTWRWRDQWRDDLHRVGYGKPLVGPRQITPLERLEYAGTAAEVTAAVRAVMGYETATDDEAAAQYPAEITYRTAGPGAVRRNADSGELEFWWLPRDGNYCDADAITLAGWYPVPCMADVEAWALDSVAKTPCGDSVEPDHPDAWPRLLGVI
jgi:hypothetical protein